MKRRSKHTGPWTREDRLPTAQELQWLQSSEGNAVCAAMVGGEPADTPAAITRWRQKLDTNLVGIAWQQVLLRDRAKNKFTRADQMLFDRTGLEQATDEIVALHKARRFEGISKAADLCCGIGGDALALAGACELTAVDYSPLRAAMAEHNVGVYDHALQTIVGDVAFERPEAEAVHIDPDRRERGKRFHQPDMSSPALDEIHRIVEHYQHAAIKLSPGVDFDLLELDAEIELISHKGECKQAVLWTGRFKQAHRRATVLPSGESISAATDDPLDWPPPGRVRPGCILHEPDAAVIRANLVGKLAHTYELAPIDERITYLVSDEPIPTSLLTPFRVIDIMDWSIKQARAWLAGHNIGRVDIKTRGFAAAPEEIMKRLKLSGEKQAVLFLTRVGKKPLAILAERSPK